MEENEFLQDLLECSVCLCTLSEQSKVLPCQHTFCTSCISEILNSQNELRCPECRIPVKITSLDELPSNILLIRLLEGLKQNMRVKNNNRLIKTPNQTPMKQMASKLTVLQTPTTSNQKQLISNVKNRNIKTSNLQQMHATYDNGSDIRTSLQMPWQKHDNQQQQIIFISPKQQLTNNGQQMIYGTNNFTASTNYHQTNQITNQRRPPAQLNLDNTLVKQSLTDIPTLPSNNLILNNQQTNNKTIANTPTCPINIPTTSSIMNSNLNNTISSPFVLNNQLINKPIMMNARALRDSDQIGNWSIKKNDILFIKEQLNPYWYLAVFNGIQGVVPISFVEIIPNNNLLKKNTTAHSTYSTLPNSNSIVYQPNVNNVNNQATTSQFQSNSLQLNDDIQLPLPQQYFQQFTLCRALYDFRITDANDKNCLNFKKNDLITLIRRVDDNWLEGSLNNNIGIFPITFVEFLPTVRPTTRSSSQSSNSSNFNSNQTAIKQQAGCLSKPPIYQPNRSAQNNNNSGPLISNRNTMNISHSRSNSINHQNSTALPIVNSVPEVMHTRSNSISIINGQQQQQQQQQNILNNPHHYNNDFNHTNPFSFDNLEEQSNSNLINLSSSSSNSYDNLLDIKSSSSQSKTNQNLYVALYNYHPQKKDELALKKNELYVIQEKHLDGWYLAKSLKDNSSGVCPGNYLIPKNNHQSHQTMLANRRSFGNLSNNKFDSADNLLNNTMINEGSITKPKQLLTSSIDNNLSDLNETISKISLNTNAKSENYLSNQKNEQQQNIISKSVEQLNNNNSNFDSLIGMTNLKKSDSNNSSTESSPQWNHHPKIKALSRSINKNEQINSQLNNNKQTSQESSYSLDLSGELRIEISTNGNNTAHVIKEVINTPIKKEDKKVNLIKMFTELNDRDMNDLEFYLACFFLTLGSLIVLYLLIKYLFHQIIIRKTMKNELKRQTSSKDEVAGGFKRNTLFKVLATRKERSKKSPKATIRFSELCYDLDKKEKLINPFLSNDSSGSSSEKSNMQLNSSGLDPVLDPVRSKLIASDKINSKLNQADYKLVNIDKLKKTSKLGDVESEKVGTSNIYSKETTKTNSKPNQNFREDGSKSRLEGYPIDDEILVKIHTLNKQQKPETNKNLLEDNRINAELLGIRRKSDEKYSLSTVYGPDSVQALLSKKHSVVKQLKLIKVPKEYLLKGIGNRKESDLKYSLSTVYGPDSMQEVSKLRSEKQFTLIKMPEEKSIKIVKDVQRQYKSLESIKSINKLSESIEIDDYLKDNLQTKLFNKKTVKPIKPDAKSTDPKKQPKDNLKQHKLVTDTRKPKKLTKDYPLMPKKIKAGKIGKDIDVKRPKKYRAKKIFKEGESLDINDIKDSEEISVQISTISRMSSTDITRKISPSKINRRK